MFRRDEKKRKIIKNQKRQEIVEKHDREPPDIVDGRILCKSKKNISI